MYETPTNLEALRQAKLESERPSSSGKAKQEKVYKMFNSAERAAAIKAEPAKVRIGSGPESREVTILPMNPRQLVAAYGLLQDILMPLVGVLTTGAGGSIPALMEALGPKIDQIPKLVEVILQRGNNVSLDWINENLDILLDLQIIIPIFLKQNGLDKLFGGGNDEPGDPTSSDPALSEATPQTAE